MKNSLFLRLLCLLALLIVCLIIRLIDRLIARSIDRLIDWLVGFDYLLSDVMIAKLINNLGKDDTLVI